MTNSVYTAVNSVKVFNQTPSVASFVFSPQFSLHFLLCEAYSKLYYKLQSTREHKMWVKNVCQEELYYAVFIRTYVKPKHYIY